MELLKKGVSVLKYGRTGKAHASVLTLSDNEAVLSWEDGRGGVFSSLSAITGKLQNKKRAILIDECVELLVGAESNVFRRCVDAADGDASMCFSLLVVGGAASIAAAAFGGSGSGSGSGSGKVGGGAAPRESLDLRCTDELQFARLVAAFHALLVRESDSNPRPSPFAKHSPRVE